MFNKTLPQIPLINEQQLLDQADSILRQADYNYQTLQNTLTQMTDTDAKTALYYQYLKNKHQHFISKFNKQSLQLKISKKPKHFIIIPALLHEKYPALGGDGKLFAEIARNFGHKVDILNVSGGLSRQTLLRVLLNHMRTFQGEKFCFVGISRGTADIFSYLKLYGFKQVDVVINISGIIKGTPLSSFILATRWRRFKYRLIAKYSGVDYRVINELCAENTFFHDTEYVATNIRLINIIGIPIKSHIQPHLLKRYLALAKMGPNDGMIMLEPYLSFPGHTYPIWGSDHFFRLPGYSRILYQLFSLLEGDYFE